MVGAVLSGLGFIPLTLTQSLAQSYGAFLLIFLGLLSVGFRTGFGHSSLGAVNRWFSRKKGLAMSVVTMGYGFGGRGRLLSL
jgi:hypothetical protein